MTLPPELIRLNQELEDAARRDLARAGVRTGRPRVRSLGIALATLSVFAGAGAAVTSQLLSGDEVAAGMPLGSAVFQGTKPVCTAVDDGGYECALSAPPRVEAAQQGWGGAKFAFVDEDSRIAGGCVGQDATGLRWRCYLGREAVERGVLDEALLGGVISEPGRG